MDPNFDFANATEKDLYNAVIAKKRELMPDYTDENITDTGIVLMRSAAFRDYLLLCRINQMAREAFLALASQRKSVINICHSLSYKLRLNIASMILLQFTATGPTTIPAGTKVAKPETETNPEIVFEVNEEVAVTGAGTWEAYGTQGESKEEAFSSDGSADQEFDLGYSPLIKDSIYALIEGGGEIWHEVDSFVGTDENDRVFEIRVDENDNATIVFGDGHNGMVPEKGTNNITVHYRIGGGNIGNVGANTVTVLKQTVPFISAVDNKAPAVTSLVKDVIPESTEVQVKSTEGFKSAGIAYVGSDNFGYTGKEATKFTGVTGITVNHFTGEEVSYSTGDVKGRDAETIEEARWNAPANLRALERCVTLPDYEYIARKYCPEVAQALAYIESGIIHLAIVPCYGGAPNLDLLAEVELEVGIRKMAKDNVVVMAPAYVLVDVEAEILCKEFYDFEKMVKPDIETALTEFLSPLTQDESGRYVNTWARSIYASQIISLIAGVEGVLKVDLKSLTKRVPLKGTITIENPPTQTLKGVGTQFQKYSDIKIGSRIHLFGSQQGHDGYYTVIEIISDTEMKVAEALTGIGEGGINYTLAGVGDIIVTGIQMVNVGDILVTSIKTPADKGVRVHTALYDRKKGPNLDDIE